MLLRIQDMFFKQKKVDIYVFTAGSPAGGGREPGQAGNRAAISGYHVVWV